MNHQSISHKECLLDMISYLKIHSALIVGEFFSGNFRNFLITVSLQELFPMQADHIPSEFVLDLMDAYE